MIDPFFYVIAAAAILVAIIGSATIWRADRVRADEVAHRAEPEPVPAPAPAPALRAYDGPSPR